MAPPRAPGNGGIARQIIGSFEDIGKDVARETAKVPVDVAGTALESLGASSGKKSGATQTVAAADAQGGETKPEGPLERLSKTDDETTKRLIARSALAELAGVKQQQKEPTVWELIQQEEAQKKERKTIMAKQQAMSDLPVIRGKPKRGSLYGIKQKSSTEMSKNTRQD